MSVVLAGDSRGAAALAMRNDFVFRILERGAEMAEQREFKIGVLAGDGIGPEITDATIEVLHTPAT